MLRGIVFFTDSSAHEDVTVFDTTLRDGEQTPGIAFTFEQKLEIARQLSDIGVHAIEAGFPASSKAEKETVAAIKKLGLESVICGLARSVKADVDACLDCNVDMVHVFIPTSDIQRENTINKSRKEVLEITADIIGHVRKHSDLCMFSAMDATRTDWDYLIEVFQTAADAGATIINVPDTVGVISPSAMKTLITRINREVEVPDRCPLPQRLRPRGRKHDRGGRGRRLAGAGDRERARGAGRQRRPCPDRDDHGVDLPDQDRDQKGAARRDLAARLPVLRHRHPAHPAGGRRERLLARERHPLARRHQEHGHVRAGHHDPGDGGPPAQAYARQACRAARGPPDARRCPYRPDRPQLDAIVEKVKAIANRGKRVTDADLYEIAESMMGIELNHKMLDLQDIAIMTGNHVIPTASVKAMVNGKEHVFSAVGNGPVDAALNAILGITPSKLQLKEFNIEAISGGSDAMCHVTIAVEDEHGKIFDASGSGDDIVLSSVEALVNAINLINRV